MAGTPYLICSASNPSGGLNTLYASVTTSVANGDSINVGVLVSAAGVTPVVSDTQGNSYTQALDSTTEATAQLYVFQCENAAPLTAGTDEIIAAYSATTSVQGLIAVGDNGVDAADKMNIAAGASGTTTSVISGTLSQAEENVIGFVCNAAGGGIPTWAAPYSSHVLANVEGGTTTRLSAAYTTVSATSSLNMESTITSAAWSSAIITEEVSPPQIATNLSDGVVNVAYSQTLTTSGGVGPYTYSLTSGSLPTGTSLASGVISGTPTVIGTFSFTIQVADTHSLTNSSSMSIQIIAVPASAGALPLPNNLLSYHDSDFESGVGTWAADVNASGVTTSSVVSLTGSHSLTWTSTAAGLTQVHTGLYPCQPTLPYIASGYLFPAQSSYDCFIGIEWYTATGSLISTVAGNDCVANSIGWQPVSGTFTSPSTAYQMRIFAQIEESNAGDRVFLDLVYATQTSAQILIDFVYPPYTQNSTTGSAGDDFMDISMWVRMDVGITANRGRQDAISEIQTGSCTFQCENDTGLFTKLSTTSLITALGGAATLSRRCQVNLADQNGAWYTRFDGPISEINYTFDDTGNTSLAAFSVADVLAYMQRGDELGCWTLQTVLGDAPQYCWPLNDASSGGSYPVAKEVTGNNGPAMRGWNSDSTNAASVAFASTTAGIETLADAIAPYSTLDGSEYWTPGSDQPSSQIRGLDSQSNGPYSTPQGGPYFSPTVTAGSAVNNFTTNAGYQMNVQFPNQLIDTENNGPYWTLECWFTMDPSIAAAAKAGTKVGPYVVMSLGSSRQNDTIVAGLWMNNTTTLNFTIATYSQPPAFSLNNFHFDPTILASSTLTIPLDDAPIPHHLVLQIAGAATGSVGVDGWLDTNEIGQITVRAGATYDTLCIGGAYGGYGSYFGMIQNVSIYNYGFSSTQLTNHCAIGQYGMWESTTDDTIAAIAQFTGAGDTGGVPTFWNGLNAAHQGLTLCDYLDLTGTNALGNMQVYEVAEQGLLYVNAAGQLSFYTRDWKMGYPGPDLYLPPDTFDAAMGYEVVDQFLTNEAAVSTSSVSAAVTAADLIFNTGTSDMGANIIVQASWVNQQSQDEYGIYATNSISSPLQLPLISWSRGYGNLGIAPFVFWPDPNLSDMAQWQANHFAEPFLTPGQLVIDMLTLTDTAYGAGGLAWSFTVAGTPINKTYFIVTTSQSENIQIGDKFTDTSNAGTTFVVASIGAPFGGFVNISFTPAAAATMSSGDVVTQAARFNPDAIGISDLYALEIGKMIAPSGTLPASFPNQTGAMEWFIEGISETFSQSTRTWACYTSPALYQRCWRPGDPVYGVLGTTSMIGLSEPDTSIPQADGKSVSHDGGPPYWPPTFTTDINLCTASPTFATGTTAGWSIFQGTATIDNGTLYPGGPNLYSAVLVATSGDTTSLEGSPSSFTVTVGNTYTSNAWVYCPIGARTVNVGVDWQSAGHAYLSTAVTSISVPSQTWTYLESGNLVAPSSAAFAYPRCGSTTTSDTIVITGLTCVNGVNSLAGMNNPAQDGHGFIGSLDIRGLHDTLALMLQPPMLCVGAVNNQQSYGSGDAGAPEVNWDTIFIDTIGGMGAVAGYPNWYCCLLAGFYDIDACVGWNNASAGGGSQGWIAVSAAGAQFTEAGGVGGPTATAQYVCPIGESTRFNTSGIANNVNASSTRMYLGVGDMVAVCAQQNTGGAKSLDTNWGGARMSLLFRGYGQTDDRVEINSSLLIGGTVGAKTQKGSGVYTMQNSATYSYYGEAAQGGKSYAYRNTNGYCYQGTGSGDGHITGACMSQVVFPWATMRTALTAAGATVTSISLTCTNVTTYYASGAYILLGYSTAGPGSGSYFYTYLSNCHSNLLKTWFDRGEKRTFKLPTTLWSPIMNTATMLMLGVTNDDTLDHYGYWNGGPGWWTMTIDYSTG